MPDIQQVIGSNSRDLSVLVRQVREVLPHHSEDMCCQALVEADEDVMQAVEILLSRPPKAKAKPKKGDKGEKDKVANTEKPSQNHPGAPSSSGSTYNNHDRELQAASSMLATPPGVEISPSSPKEEQLPLTPAGKELMKMQKKLREVLKIEERIAAGVKVDKMQLEKLERKWEIKAAVVRQEQICAKEDDIRRAELAVERQEQAKRDLVREEELRPEFSS